MSDESEFNVKLLIKNQQKIIDGLKSLHRGLKALHKKVDRAEDQASEAASRHPYDDTELHNRLIDVEYEVGRLVDHFLGDESGD